MLLVVAMGVAAAGASQYAGAKHDIGLMRSLGLDPRQPVPEVSVGELQWASHQCPVGMPVFDCNSFFTLPRPCGLQLNIVGWFNQTLDHTATGTPTLWPQRYQYNETYSSAGGPVFLLLGGEGPANPLWLATNTAVMTYALRAGAAVYQLEHRFYGVSQPFQDLSDAHLKFLTSQQALADADNFVRTFILPKHGANTKVISFGGSYSGALSAWLRLKYPNTIYAAVSTSSPIVAVENFKEYQQVVQNSLETATNGAACVDRIREATGRFEQFTTTAAGLMGLATMFNTCKPIAMTKNEIANLMSTLAGAFDGVVQYNKDNREFEHPGSPAPPDLNDVCKAVLGGINPGMGYAAAVQLVTDFKDQCTDVSYTGMIAEMKNTSLQSDVAGGSRQWVWQTCNEFGYFQSSDANTTTQPFGSLFPVDFSVQQCTDIYGTTSGSVASAIDDTNNFYGADKYAGSRVIFVNGDIDPWHALSLPPQAQDKNDITSVLISGTAHCANMYPPASTDLPGLTAARASVEAALARWL